MMELAFVIAMAFMSLWMAVFLFFVHCWRKESDVKVSRIWELTSLDRDRLAKYLEKTHLHIIVQQKEAQKAQAVLVQYLADVVNQSVQSGIMTDVKIKALVNELGQKLPVYMGTVMTDLITRLETVLKNFKSQP
jgi:hypothetical protein